MNAKIRLGIIGLGNMGTAHSRTVQDIPAIELTAVSDIQQHRVEKIATKYACKGFADPKALMKSGLCDAVLIATPHYDHTPLGIYALKHKLHLLVEKPISAHKADCEKLIRAHKDPSIVFAAMFNQRTNPYYQKIREMVKDGTLGEIRRINWTITDWFRAQSYYDSGGWRATWGGEGGGVLLNQCPHQLDLLQWMFGMPAELQAFCSLGKYHDIEVEDEVTAFLTYPNGAGCTFTTTTGEAPGVNRLEVAAENGLLIYDTDDKCLQFRRNAKSTSLAIAENRGFEKPEINIDTISISHEGRQHVEVIENFVSAIRDGETLIAPAAEGIHSVELANAMLFSSAKSKPVQLPLSARAYANQLNQWIANSRYMPEDFSGNDKTEIADLSDTF